MNVRELVTRIGFDVNTQGLKQADKSVDSLKTKVVGLSKSLNSLRLSYVRFSTIATVVGGSLLAFTTAAANNIRANEEMALKLGTSNENLQELENLAQSSGAKVGELSTSMLTLAKKSRDVVNGVSGSSKEFSKLGVSVRDTNGKVKDSYSLYTEVARKIKAIKSPLDQATLSQKLLGTSSLALINTFSQSNEQLEKQREEIRKLTYVIDSKGMESTNKFLQSWSKLKLMFKSISTSIALQLMPAITESVEGIKDWYIENRQLIHQNLKGVVEGVVSAFKVFATVTSALFTPVKYLIELCGGLGNTLSIVATITTIAFVPAMLRATAAFAAFTVALLANPFTWLAVALAAFVNDMYHWVNDNDSVLGSILGSWEDFKNNIFSIIDSITGYFTKSFDGINDAIDAVFNKLPILKALVDKTLSSVGLKDSKISVTNEKDNVKSYTIKNGSLLSKNDATTLPFANNVSNTNVTKQFNSPLISPSSNPINNSTSNSAVNNRITQNITENITVNVPVGTTQEVAISITEQITEAFNEQFRHNMVRANDALAYR